MSTKLVTRCPIKRSPLAPRTPRERLDIGEGPLSSRSRVTNGSELLPGLDGRSLWARRFRDLVCLHVSDLGGETSVSQSQLSLVRRAAALTVELERLETQFATEDDAKTVDMERHQRATNTLRRVLTTLGIERRLRTIDGKAVTDATAEIVHALRERRG